MARPTISIVPASGAPAETQRTGRNSHADDHVPRRVVITGIGVVNPAGKDRETFWSTLCAGKTAIRRISRFDASGLPISLAAEVCDFDAAKRAPRRLVVKSDRFAHYAMAAADEALRDADLDISALDPFRIGISFGNNSGGWDICERGFEEYYHQSPSMINPWQATAWFPTAPQGFVSICFGLRGYSKSFACDRASGACGVLFAVRSILWGHNDVVLTGGAEAPITRLGVAAHVSTGEMSRAAAAEDSYLPFDRDRNGLVLGEGSTVLVLEELEHARQRGARIYGEIFPGGQRTGDPTASAALEAAIRDALDSAGSTPEQVDVVFAEGSGTQAGDWSEAAALNAVFGSRAVSVTVPKAAYGHLYGASFGTELACALLGMRDGIVPPTVQTRNVDEHCAVTLVSEAMSASIDTALVNSRSREGTNIALVARALRLPASAGRHPEQPAHPPHIRRNHARAGIR